MTLDDVPPDTITTLTEELMRLFRYAGCEPECHACQTSIEIGDKFQLAAHGKVRKQDHEEFDIVSRDVMLCATCTIPDLIRRERSVEREARAWKKLHPGYSRPSRGATLDERTELLRRRVHRIVDAYVSALTGD